MKTKAELIREAQKLRQPSEAAKAEFSDKKSRMIEKLNNLLLSTHGFEQAVPAERIEMLKDNHYNQFRFMESIYNNFNAEVFVNIIAWAFSVYQNHNFDLLYWDYLFPAVQQVYKEELSQTAFRELSPFYQWMADHKNDFIRISG